MLGKVQNEARKFTTGFRDLECEVRLEKLGLTTLEIGRLTGDLTGV